MRSIENHELNLLSPWLGLGSFYSKVKRSVLSLGPLGEIPMNLPLVKKNHHPKLNFGEA